VLARARGIFMIAPVAGSLPRITCPGLVGVPNGTNAPVITDSSLSVFDSGFFVVKFCPTSLMSFAGMSQNVGWRFSQPNLSLSSPTTALLVAVPMAK
jgi:hypothetical protein